MLCPYCGTQAANAAQFCSQCGKLLPKTASGIAIDAKTGQFRNYAGFWRRTVAMVIDGLILLLVGQWVFQVLIPEGLGSDTTIIVWLSIVLYFTGFEASPLMCTPGKFLMQIKVTTLRGERIGLGRAIARTLAGLLSVVSLGIGFYVAAVTPRRQALQDLVSRTLVVSIKQQPERAMLPAGTTMPFSAPIAWFVIVAAVWGFFVVGSVWNQEPKSLAELISDIRADGKDDPKAVGRSVRLKKDR